MFCEYLRLPCSGKFNFPRASERREWERIAARPEFADYVRSVLEAAARTLAAPIPEERADLFMEFHRTGNRAHYEANYFARRKNLRTLTLAECLEHQGRFLDGIINYLWAISGEHTWVVPAHTQSEDVLISSDSEVVDLFSSQTAMNLAFVLELLETELTAVSPALVSTIRRSIIEKTLIHAENAEQWWFAGRNNWTPWCALNVSAAAMTVFSDQPERRDALLRRMAVPVDRYIEHYSNDGGCDEGITYWSVSPGKLFTLLLLLEDRKAIDENIFSEPKLRRMLDYPGNAALHPGLFFSFSDSTPHLDSFPVGTIARMAEKCNSPEATVFARSAFSGFSPDFRYVHNAESAARVEDLPLELFTLFHDWRDGDRALPDGCAFYPDVQQLICRASGVGFGVKGGHNKESHNHLDLGEFMLAVDGKVIVADLGGPEYTRDVFSGKRYENWILNSIGHNAPRFGGVGQLPGREYATRAADFSDDGVRIVYELELTDAYPEELKLESLFRRVEYDRKNCLLTVRDRWKSALPHPVEIALYTALAVANGRIGDVAFQARGGVLNCAAVSAPDPKVAAAWGQKLNKITLSAAPAVQGGLELQFFCRPAPAQ